MIRINGHDYVAVVVYPTEKLVATLITDKSLSEVLTDVTAATQVQIINNGEVQAVYDVSFYGIEVTSNGFKATFARTPMTIAEIEELQTTVSSHTESISSQSAQIAAQASTIAANTSAIADNTSAINNQTIIVENHDESIQEQAATLSEHTTDISDVNDALIELAGLIGG